MSASRRNIQDPVWTRWASVSLFFDCIYSCSLLLTLIALLDYQNQQIFLDNYCSIYFLAVAIKTHYKADAYICKVACTLLSLMNEAAEPSCLNGTNDNSMESLIDSQDPDRDIHHYSDQQSSTSPTFYTMLLFHRSFCENLFDNTFNFLLRDDPYFGINTFGQAARLMPERIYVVHEHL